MNLVLVANVVSLKRLFNTGDRQAGGRWAESHGTLGGITRDAGRTHGTRRRLTNNLEYVGKFIL